MEKFLMVEPDMEGIAVIYNKRTGHVYTLGDEASVRLHRDECLEDMPSSAILPLDDYYRQVAVKRVPLCR